MKRFFIAIFFLIFISVSCILSVNQLDKNTAAIKEEIDQIRQAVTSNDKARADDAMQRLIDHWENKKRLFYALAGSNECAPFDSALDRSKVWLELGADHELFVELAELYTRISILWDTQAIRPKNLF
ncbi:MAG: DUF4363 family protein [Candidatus Fimivivens sp.]